MFILNILISKLIFFLGKLIFKKKILHLDEFCKVVGSVIGEAVTKKINYFNYVV